MRSTEFSRSGDSGAAILAADGSAIVGVMFASGISNEGRLVDVTYFIPAGRAAGTVNTLLGETVLKSLTPAQDFNIIHRSKYEPRTVSSTDGEKLVATDDEKSATEEEKKTEQSVKEEKRKKEHVGKKEKDKNNRQSGKKAVEEMEKRKSHQKSTGMITQSLRSISRGGNCYLTLQLCI